jgi:hypothetical protein
MRYLARVAGFLAAVAAWPGAVWAAPVEPLSLASGPSPFIGCTADGPYSPTSVNYPNTEVEPWVAVVNPRNPDNLVGGWQQDRWNDGGAKSNLAGVSFDGGRTWRQVVIPKITVCSGGTAETRTDFQRASDPWVTFSPDGTAYFMSLVTDVTNPPNRPGGLGRKSGMVVNVSEDGGQTWSDPIILVREDNPRVLHDKNTITADPNDPNYVYAVWDRLQVPTGAIINPENVVGLGFKGPAVLSRTTDGGLTWTAPVQVNLTPNRPGHYGAAFTPAIRVADDGTIGILYYDFRNHVPGNLAQLSTDAWLVRYRVSGGALMLVDDTRVTPVSFDMRQAPVARGFFVGDYIGLGVVGSRFKPFFTISTAADKADVVATTVGP